MAVGEVSGKNTSIKQISCWAFPFLLSSSPLDSVYSSHAYSWARLGSMHLPVDNCRHVASIIYSNWRNRSMHRLSLQLARFFWLDNQMHRFPGVRLTLDVHFDIKHMTMGETTSHHLTSEMPRISSPSLISTELRREIFPLTYFSGWEESRTQSIVLITKFSDIPVESCLTR